ncbi:MAG: class I SAM-dependent RNA methyltransferase [Candidatus Cloacimonetes bacterium]|nr:class I SAM-dependent RNA methyltransferase [Candidatus Cloacimonadota bacterium]
MEYLNNNKYFAQVAGSLEKIAAMELEELGATDIQTTYRGVSFQAEQADLYRILYQTRICTRILAPLISFQAHSEKYLYSQALQFDWRQLFTIDKTFGISTNVANSKIDNSLYAGQTLKDAICDKFREIGGNRPDYDQKEPDVRLNLHINENWVNISLDLGGEPLHKRGYRLVGMQATLQETLAAAIVRVSQWEGERPFCDPFCGSGTLLEEAMMLYCKIPAGYLRKKWGIIHLPDFSTNRWTLTKYEADQQIRDLPPDLIIGSDIMSRNVSITRKNLNVFHQGANVKVNTADFRNLPEMENITIVCNPPFGKRLRKEEIDELLQDLGDFFKQKCKNSRAYVLVGGSEFSGALRLRSKMNKLLKNGDIDSRLLCLDLY